MYSVPTIFIQNFRPLQDRLQNTVDVTLEIIDAFQPNINASKEEQAAVLQEFGTVSIKGHRNCRDCN